MHAQWLAGDAERNVAVGGGRAVHFGRHPCPGRDVRGMGRRGVGSLHTLLQASQRPVASSSPHELELGRDPHVCKPGIRYQVTRVRLL